MGSSVEFNAILDHAFMRSPEGMAVLFSNNGDFNWIKVNPAFCNLLGFTEAEFLAGALLQNRKIERHIQKSSPID